MRTAQVYLRTTAAAFVLFWFVVRWEKYEVRYMLPYLALFCVAVPLAMGLILSRLLQERQVHAVLVVLTVLLLVPILGSTRDMVDYHGMLAAEEPERPLGYYKYRVAEYEPQRDLCTAILDAGYTSVGVQCDGDYYEYPIWSWLGGNVRIEHVLVENETAQYEDKSFQPDCILYLGRDLPVEYAAQGRISYHEREYRVQMRYDDGHVLMALH